MTESPARFRKKPVEIQAMQWRGDNTTEVIDWVLATGNRAARWHEETDLDTAALERCPRREHIAIDTLEGTMHAMVGDWIIRGIKGEIYPCKPDIFAATYETAPEPLELSEVERAALMTDFHFSTCDDQERCPDCAHKVKEYRAVLAAVSEPIAEQAREEHLLELGAAGRLHLPCSTMSPEFGIVWLAADGFVVEKWGCASLERVRELLAENPRPARADRFEVQSREIWTSPWADVPEEALKPVDEPEAVTGQ